MNSWFSDIAVPQRKDGNKLYVFIFNWIVIVCDSRKFCSIYGFFFRLKSRRYYCWRFSFILNQPSMGNHSDILTRVLLFFQDRRGQIRWGSRIISQIAGLSKNAYLMTIKGESLPLASENSSRGSFSKCSGIVPRRSPAPDFCRNGRNHRYDEIIPPHCYERLNKVPRMLLSLLQIARGNNRDQLKKHERKVCRNPK